MSSIGFHTQIIISQGDLLALHLSVPGWNELSRPPVNRGLVRHDVPHAVSFVPAALKRSYPEHVARFACGRQDSRGHESRTVLAWGTRNTFQNLGLPGWDRRQSPRLLCRIDEPWHHWTYSGFGMETSGRLALFRVRFAESADGEAIPLHVDSEAAELSWFVAGQPILWDGELPPLPTLAAMTYDLRHIWDLKWEDWQHSPTDFSVHDELMTAFLQNLRGKPEDRAEQLAAIADRCQLRIMDSYLHSSLGMTRGGDLILLMKTGSLSEIGSAQRELGAHRAILLDNGGSVGAAYWSTFDGANPAAQGPVFVGNGSYFRPRGHAILVAELAHDIPEGPSTAIDCPGPTE